MSSFLLDETVSEAQILVLHGVLYSTFLLAST